MTFCLLLAFFVPSILQLALLGHEWHKTKMHIYVAIPLVYQLIGSNSNSLPFSIAPSSRSDSELWSNCWGQCVFSLSLKQRFLFLFFPRSVCVCHCIWLQLIHTSILDEAWQGRVLLVPHIVHLLGFAAVMKISQTSAQTWCQRERWIIEINTVCT